MMEIINLLNIFRHLNIQINIEYFDFEFTFFSFISMFRLIYYFVNVINMSQVERRKKTYVSEN